MKAFSTHCPIYDQKLMLDFKELIDGRRYSCKINNRASMVAKCDECNSWFVKEGKMNAEKLEQDYVFCNSECQRKSQSSGVLKEKKRRVFLEKYGVDNPSSCLEVQDRKRKNSIEKHGCDFNSLPGIKAKRKATWIKNYGCDNPNKSPEIMAKRRATTLEKYGCKDYLGTQEARDFLKEYSMKTYGVEHFMQSQEFRDIKDGEFYDKHGVENPLQLEEIKNKIRATCMQKYGVDNALKTPKARAAFYLALNNNTNLSSKIEEEFYECLQEHGKECGYTVRHQINIKDRWIIDFYIPEIDTYIEFDGVFWHGINKTIEELQELVDKSKTKTGIWKGILNNKHKDAKVNKWFEVCGKKLVRLTDEDYLKAKNQGNVKVMIENLLGRAGVL